jgi:hypothetical protein
VLAGIGVLGLIFTITGQGSVRDYVAGHYRLVGKQKVQGASGETLVYASSRSITRTSDEIAKEHKPADRRTTESGEFLRYENDIVAILPPDPGKAGSKVTVDDEQTGYRHHFLYLGGWWGRYSGPAESFRGGGPGGGK